MAEENMVIEETWLNFRDTGLLWFINQTLHLFGWAIVVELDANGNITKGFPARCKFRGFDEKSTTEGYGKVTKYLQENISNLSKDLDE